MTGIFPFWRSILTGCTRRNPSSSLPVRVASSDGREDGSETLDPTSAGFEEKAIRPLESMMLVVAVSYSRVLKAFSKETKTWS